MNNKEQFDFYYKVHGLTGKEYTPEARIKLLADTLLLMLYSPILTEGLWRPNWSTVEIMGIDKSEPVNWTDFKSSVEDKNGYYLVTIDEAAPHKCPTLCAYIEKYLTAWGWNVRVETEW